MRGGGVMPRPALRVVGSHDPTPAPSNPLEFERVDEPPPAPPAVLRPRDVVMVAVAIPFCLAAMASLSFEAGIRRLANLIRRSGHGHGD